MDGQWNNVLPRPIAFVFSGDASLGSLQVGMRQRLLVEAPLIAQRLPVVYLPAPALPHHSLLDFDYSVGLMAQTAAHVAHFLATASCAVTSNSSGSSRWKRRRLRNA